MQTYLSGRELSPFRQLVFVLNRISRLLWKTNKKAFLITVFANVLYSSVIIPTVYLDKLFIDTILKSIGSPDIGPAMRIIFYIVFGRLLIGIFTGLMSRLAGNYDDILSREFASKLEALMAQKYTSLDIPTIEDPEFQDRYQKIQQEGSGRAYRLVSSFADFPGSVTGVISSLSIFFFFQPFIVVLAIITLIPQFLVDAKLVRRRYRINEQLRTTQRLNGMLSYYLIRAKSYLELRLLQASEYLIDRLVNAQNRINTTYNTLSRERIISRSLAVIPQNIFSYSLDIYFAYNALIQKISIGTAQAYIRAISSFNTNLFNLAGTIIQFYENFLYVADLAWFLDLQSSADLSGTTSFVDNQVHSIKFEDVWFKYPHSDNFVLKGVTFEILKNENIALVGLNGAGKTTIIKLLTGFYKPTKGLVSINSVSVTDYSKTDLWHILAVLFQDFESYDFSARESIAVGNISQIDNSPEIRKFAQLADIDDWIMTLTKQYDTPLSPYYENGIKPSSGQWQKIGLARSMFKDSLVLILDEPTSNVDPQAEEEIFDHVLKLGQEKILIFISHRFNTVRRADRIFVLEKGTITEHGTHTELLRKKRTYAKLFNLQAKNYR